MRTVQTFILRLITSSDKPLALCGSLKTVANGEEHSFKDEAALLAILRRLQPAPVSASPPEEEESHRESDE